MDRAVLDVQCAGFEHGGGRGVQQALRRCLRQGGKVRRDVGQAGGMGKKGERLKEMV